MINEKLTSIIVTTKPAISAESKEISHGTVPIELDKSKCAEEIYI